MDGERGTRDETLRPVLHKHDLLIGLAYLAAAVLVTWPLATHLDSSLAGGTTDTLVHYWNGWWVKQALSAGQSPYQTPLLFFPQVLNLVTHNFAWWSIALWLGLRPVLGGIAAYNGALLLNLALCGMAVFWLVRQVSGSGRAALIAGLIYLAWPHRLAQLDHPNLISTQWIPLFALFLWRALRSGRWQDGLLTGLFLVLVGVTRWQLLIPAVIVGLLIAACEWRRIWQHGWRHLIPLLVAAGLTLLALSPFVWLLVQRQAEDPAELLNSTDEQEMQTDLLAYLTPGPHHLLFGQWTEAAYERYYADRNSGRRFTPYVGLVALGLAAGGFIAPGPGGRRKRLPWLLAALVFAGLALGPVLRVNGQLYPALPTPYRLLAWTGLVRLMRLPDRYSLFLALPLAVLAGQGLADLLRRWQRPTWATALLAGLVLLDFLALPAALQDVDLSPFYSRLAESPGEGALLNLPIDAQQAKRYMFAQVVHGRPILQGKTARIPAGTYDYFENNAWLRSLRQNNEISTDRPDISRELGQLAADGVEYLVLHKLPTTQDSLPRWQTAIPWNPAYEDDDLVVYRTEPQWGRDYVLNSEVAPGVGPVRVITSAGCATPGAIWSVDVAWGATEAPAQESVVEVTLVNPEGLVVTTVLFPNGPQMDWTANTIAWRSYVLRLPADLAAGRYRVTAALVDPSSGQPWTGSVELAAITVQDSACDVELPEGYTAADVVYGDVVRLLGYRVQQTGGRVKIDLNWRGEQRTSTRYKVFVHVSEPATGVPVAQADLEPNYGGYPTTLWLPGVLVNDKIEISLAGVPAGEYEIAVGLYDPQTTDRLPPAAGDGSDTNDGRYVLPGETVRVD